MSNCCFVTEENYNTMLEIFDRMDAYAETGDVPRKIFPVKYGFPKVADMKKLHIEDNLEMYLPYILFYCMQPLPELKDNKDFLESLEYLKDLYYNYVIIDGEVV